MIKNFAINKNKHSIHCKLYYSGNDVRKVILHVHGFAGHKDNKAMEKFSERVLTKYKNTAVMTFNLPCHGDDVKKKINLQDCMTYIEYAVDYIESELHAEEIYSYATSFGGYLVLKYIAENGNPFRKIALRCPAVNMAETLMNSVIRSDELAEIRKGKSVPVGFDRKIEVNAGFLSELEESDVQKIDYLDYADDILILHGTKDEVVPFEADRRFADNNVIEFIAVENADHRFQNPECMEIATKAVLSFFSL